MPHLENWACAPNSLIGEVSNHPGFEDGTVIMTSTPVGKRNGNVVTYSGSEYTLGQARSDYEAIYPEAASRLLHSLPEMQ